jgi:hypothetical protein
MILEAVLVKTSLFLVPSLEVKFPIGDFYFKQVSSAECEPKELNALNPMTTTWITEIGYEKNAITAFIGHKSYHAVDELNRGRFKSYDYFGVSFKKEFK